MQVTKKQFQEIINSLPDFERYPYEYYEFAVLQVAEVVRKNCIAPDDIVPIETIRFVKNHRIEEWVLDLKAS